MGCALSCEVDEEFATFLQWVVEQRSGVVAIGCYLYDFNFAGKDFVYCSKLMVTVKQIGQEFRVTLAEDK